MTTAWHGLQHEPISWEMFLGIDEAVRRELEIVDGYVVPREQRSRDHQKVATRLSLALETAAVQQVRTSGGGECYETNTEVDVLLWGVPPTARKPDAVLYRCLPDAEQLAAGHVLIAAEVLSAWSARRDRVHKMSDYADAGIPHWHIPPGHGTDGGQDLSPVPGGDPLDGARGHPAGVTAVPR
jgi:Uma2 family endonuclease